MRLHGERLDGTWTLVPAHLDGNPKNWLLLRKDAKDGAAGGTRQYRPMLATATDKLPTGDGWAFEPKWDGFRALAYVNGGDVSFKSRNDNDLTGRFAPAARALARAVRSPSAVLDGEICALDESGRSGFGLLQQGSGTLVFAAFDVLERDGEPLLERTYVERRQALEALLDTSIEGVLMSPSFDDGVALERAAREHGLEGVVAKRNDSTYQPGRRSLEWRKLKLKHRQELVIAGYTRGQGRRANGIGALVLAVHDAEGLRYAGNVGTGFDDRELDRAREAADSRYGATTLPFAEVPKMPKVRRGDVTWVEPKLVAEIEFAEWTRDGRLRAPVYVGLRDDKPAEDVVAERVPMPEEIRRGRRVLKLSNLDKPFWPDEGITKGDLLAYYRDIAPVLVPHLEDRPFTMKRYPDGWQGKFFFQKDAPKHMPEWIARAPFPASTREGERRVIDYALVNDDLALLWMVNMGCIDMNAWGSRADRPDKPDWIMFDLDPSDDVGFAGGDRGGGAREADARPCRARELREDERLARDPRPRADRPSTGVRRDAVVRSSRRRRARAHPSGARDDTVDEAEATRCPRRREPERPGKDDRNGLLGAPARGSAGVDAAGLGRGEREARPLGVHVRRGAGPGRPARRPLRTGVDAPSVARSGIARARRLIGADRGGARAGCAVDQGSRPSGCPSVDSSAMSRRKKRAIVQSATTRSLRLTSGSA